MGCGTLSRPSSIHIQKYSDGANLNSPNTDNSNSPVVTYYLPLYNGDTSNALLGLPDLDFKRFLTKNNSIRILNPRSSLVNLNSNASSFLIPSPIFSYKYDPDAIVLSDSGSFLPQKPLQNAFSSSGPSRGNLFTNNSTAHFPTTPLPVPLVLPPTNTPQPVPAPHITVNSSHASYNVQFSYVSQRGYYPQHINKANQDSFLVASQIFNDFSTQLYGVFDGHGETGDACSHFVSDTLLNLFCYNVKLFYFNTIVKILIKQLREKLHISKDSQTVSQDQISAPSEPKDLFELDFDINYDLYDDSDFDSDDDTIKSFDKSSSVDNNALNPSSEMDNGPPSPEHPSFAEKISYYNKMDKFLLSDNNFNENFNLYFAGNNDFEDSIYYIESLNNDSSSQLADPIQYLKKIKIKKQKISTLLTLLFSDNLKIKQFLLKFLQNFDKIYVNNKKLKKYLTTKIEKILILSLYESNRYLNISRVDDSLSGTTSVTLLILEDYLYLANIGDSRSMIISERNAQNSQKSFRSETNTISKTLSHDFTCDSLSPTTNSTPTSNLPYLFYTNLSYDQTPYRIDEIDRIRNYGGIVRTMDEMDEDQKFSENYPIKNFCFSGGFLSSMVQSPGFDPSNSVILNYKNNNFNQSFYTNHLVSTKKKPHSTDINPRYYQMNNKIFNEGELVYDPLEEKRVSSSSPTSNSSDSKKDIELENHDSDTLSDPPRVWDSTMEKPGCAFTRSIGDHTGKALGILPYPEIIKYRIDKDDKFIILASDGVFEFLFNQNIVEKISKVYNQGSNINLLEVARQIVSEAYRLWLTYDDRTDDISIILIALNDFKDKDLNDVEEEKLDFNIETKRICQVLKLTSADLNKSIFSSANS